jgi:large subunit ribosomal protein L31
MTFPFPKLLFFCHNPCLPVTGKWFVRRRVVFSAVDSAAKRSSKARIATDWLPNQKGLIMKEGIHPNYREVVFQDMSSDFSFITRSTIQTKDTVVRDGKEYPLAKIEVSSESHPFYTGTQKIMDTAGRVEKFRQKFGSKLGKVAK